MRFHGFFRRLERLVDLLGVFASDLQRLLIRFQLLSRLTKLDFPLKNTGIPRLLESSCGQAATVHGLALSGRDLQEAKFRIRFPPFQKLSNIVDHIARREH